MRKIISNLLLIFAFLPSLFSNTLITLTAKQAVGGSLLKTNINDSAVFFPAESRANDRIKWILPHSLPPGLYQIDIDFYQPKGSAFSKNEFISFQTTNDAQLGFLDFYYLGLGAGSSTKSIGFYSNNVLTSLALIKGSQRNLNTSGIRAIRIRQGVPSEMASRQFVFQLTVSENHVFVPMPLPSGSYIVSAASAIATTWTVTGGTQIKVPSGISNRIYVDQPVLSTTINSGSVSSIVITHYPPVTNNPDMSSAGTEPLMQTVDSTKIDKRSLRFIGYTGKGKPQLDIFPGGKKVALVSSWDDGQLADIQLADTLAHYGIKGTFMIIAGSSPVIPQMNVLEAKGMEIGSHSWSHPSFYTSSPTRCFDEAVASKRFLESKLGHPVISFAFPFDYKAAYDVNGDYVLAALRAAGYWSGRGTSTGYFPKIDNMVEPLSMRPTYHFGVGAVKLKSRLNEMLSEPGSVLYIWGHSYELAGVGMTTLRADLAVLANNSEVWYATVGKLMLWQFIRDKLKIFPDSNTTGDISFTLEMPWLNPYLRQVPISLIVPKGVTVVEWQGVQFPVKNGRVQLMWSE